MARKIILTGDRPTGRLHLGHYVGSLQSRLQLQEQCDQYIMIADVQALTDHFAQSHTITQHVYEVAKDYLAIGLEPNKNTFFIQSQIPELTELTTYFLNLVNLGSLERNPTVKTEIQQKKFGNAIPTGFFTYPISQAADITLFQADLVPVGSDQIPMIELTNEIVRRFRRTYQTTCLKPCDIYLSHLPRLIGIDGRAKASKSLDNVIYLSDSDTAIKEKVFRMYTDPNHLHISDPGQVEGHVVFTYLDAFHHDAKEVQDLKAHYQRGGLGDVTLKKLLCKTLTNFIAPIRERRATLGDNDVKDILRVGTSQARLRAQETMTQVRAAMGLLYW